MTRNQWLGTWLIIIASIVGLTACSESPTTSGETTITLSAEELTRLEQINGSKHPSL